MHDLLAHFGAVVASSDDSVLDPFAQVVCVPVSRLMLSVFEMAVDVLRGRRGGISIF